MLALFDLVLSTQSENETTHIQYAAGEIDKVLLFSKHSALYETIHFLGLLVELYRRSSRHYVNI